MDEPPPFGLPLPCLGYGGCSAEVIIDYCKIAPCFKRQQHDWTVCFYSHPGEKACRRDLRLHSYAAVMCSNMLHKGCCPRGDGCPQSHSVFEYHMHPARFRTKLCTDGDRCRRPFCFFAHGMQQLREPAPLNSCTSRPAARHPAAAAAAGCSSGSMSQEGSSASSLGSGFSFASSTAAGTMQLERQCSGQMLMPMQTQQQQQQQQQYLLQVQQQQQQMLQVQQLETAAGSAMQQLASLTMELQQRQAAHEASAQLALAQQLCTTGLPSAPSYSAASDAQMMEMQLVQAMTGQSIESYPSGVQQSALPALQVPLQSLPQPGFDVDGSSFTPAGGSMVGGMLAGGNITELQPAAAAAGGGGGMVILNASLPAGQCYQLVHNAAGSFMVVSEGLSPKQQQQQQQQLVLLSSVPEAAMLPGQAQLPRYNSQCMQ
ncbi:hypothetical protein OEZ85_011576 [Tetradesmus obliquus]|uniref:C3H1-type domain-containing protein n=1 Tax=Tetradesmus obliquus TaxID=3088 RepID=A0ABY8TQV8_TETOB|nr:hypothetical protein OEZ85_011576 [Tetradesmus obliquus]